MQLRPVRRRSVSDDVFDQLTAQILDGGLAPGSPLPAERALAEAVGVNRQAVREALQRLAEAGLVDIHHGYATRVLDPHERAGLGLLPRLLLRPEGSVDVEVARAILEMRACLGPEVARRCAERAPTELVHDLRNILDEMRPTREDLAALAALEIAFWDRVVDGSDNIAYRLAYNSLRETYEPIAPLLADVLAEELRDLDDLDALVRSVEARDADAAAAAAARVLHHGTAAVARVIETLPQTAGATT